MAKLKDEISPMIQQYLDMKEKNKDKVLFYRVGDFYEMFFEDALEMSKKLELTLTSKDCGAGKKAPMCGVPAKALDEYIVKAVELGYKVAICEQLSTVPTDGNKIVERDILRVVTPGTIMEGEGIDEKQNNYIMSCYSNANKVGLSWIDITTGEFRCAETSSQDYIKQVNDIITVVRPKEIISNDSFKVIFEQLLARKLGILPELTIYQDWAYQFKNAEKNVLQQLNTQTLQPFECENLKFAVTASGALLEYLKETQKRVLTHINKITPLKLNTCMYIDYQTMRNLEITQNSKDGSKKGSLLSLLDLTQTAMGGRLLRQFVEQPLQKKAEIDYRLNGVAELKKNIIKRDALIEFLKGVHDIERICGKISYGTVNPKDCLDLAKSLSNIPQIKATMQGFESSILVDIENNILSLEDTKDILVRAIDENASSITKDGGFIKKGYSQELDRLKDLSTNSVESINKLEQQEKEATGIKNLKIRYNRIFGYFIEVTNSQKEMVPFRYQRRQTLANAERYITTELKQLEDEMLSATEDALKLEQDLFNQLREFLLGKVKDLQATSHNLALLDTLISFAVVASRYNYNKPVIVANNKELSIIDGRHPIVEKYNKNQFIANDTLLNNDDQRTMIITGPNMAGKSTYMRQVALIVLMAHIGCFVPAKTAQIPLTDRIFTRIGASDDLSFGQSTFMVEMVEVANILHNATNDSLIILDEVGRGTATLDGLSIARSVMEFIASHLKAKTLFSTHYHELTELEGVLEGVKNYRISVKEFNGSIIFLRKIVRGGANKSFGIEVASLAGLPEEVVNRAKQILSELEQVEAQKNSELNSMKTEINQSRTNAFEVVNIINELDLNKLSPIEALMVLNDLQAKTKN